jgi:hypothetical protein
MNDPTNKQLRVEGYRPIENGAGLPKQNAPKAGPSPSSPPKGGSAIKGPTR